MDKREVIAILNQIRLPDYSGKYGIDGEMAYLDAQEALESKIKAVKEDIGKKEDRPNQA